MMDGARSMRSLVRLPRGRNRPRGRRVPRTIQIGTTCTDGAEMSPRLSGHEHRGAQRDLSSHPEPRRQSAECYRPEAARRSHRFHLAASGYSPRMPAYDSPFATSTESGRATSSSRSSAGPGPNVLALPACRAAAETSPLVREMARALTKGHWARASDSLTSDRWPTPDGSVTDRPAS